MFQRATILLYFVISLCENWTGPARGAKTQDQRFDLKREWKTYFFIQIHIRFERISFNESVLSLSSFLQFRWHNGIAQLTFPPKILQVFITELLDQVTNTPLTIKHQTFKRKPFVRRCFNWCYLPLDRPDSKDLNSSLVWTIDKELWKDPMGGIVQWMKRI